MNRNETTVADPCPKCGAYSYRGGNCFRCGTYRPTKPRSDDEDNLDAAAFMEGTFEQRIRALEEDPAPVDQFSIRNLPPEPIDHDERPKANQQSVPPVVPVPKASILYVHPDGTILKNPPPPRGPTLAARIEQVNRRSNRDSTEQPEPPAIVRKAAPSNGTQLANSSPITKVLERSIPITPKPTAQHTKASERPAQPNTSLLPSAAAQRATAPACLPIANESAKPSAPQVPPPPSSYFPTFLVLWALIAASLSDSDTPIATGIILGAMFSIFLSLFVSFAIDWLIEQTRK